MLEHFADNLARTLGLHRLSATDAAELLGMSLATFSAWHSGRRNPSLTAVMAVAQFFDLPSDALATRPFSELLPLLADPERFQATETRIQRARSGLKSAE